MKKIYIVGFNSDYAKLDVESLKNKYNIVHIIIHPLIISILIRFELISHMLFKIMFFFVSKYYIRDFTDNAILLTDDNVVSMSFHNINFPTLRNIIMLRNVYEGRMTKLKVRKGVDYYSFDELDCKKYGFKFYNQYCSGFDILKSSRTTNILNDFYFLGRDKGRLTIISKLASELINYNCRFLIVGSEKSGLNIVKFTDYVPYRDHLINVLESRVVVDIVQKGQRGLTMRVIEALVSGRKIITNNISVKNYEFYDPTQIYLLDEFCDCSSSNISKFLETDINKGINYDLSEYNPRDVLSNIIESV